MNSLSYVDIFSGCGGLSLGLYKAGLNGLFAIEKNKDAFDTLSHNLINNHQHFEWVKWLPQKAHDINEILHSYRNELKALCGQIPLIVGGPPCQGFSTAGKRDESDGRNTLSSSYIEFVSILRPRIVFFENVYGFTCIFHKSGSKKTPHSQFVIDELEKLGYRVKFEMVDMSCYGIPQKRQRFILIGCLDQDPDIFFNKLNGAKDDFLKQRSLNLEVNVQDAINDLLRANGEVESIDTKGYKAGVYGEITSTYQQLLRGKDALEGRSVDSHRFTKHTSEMVEINTKMLSCCPKGKRITPKDGYVEGFRKRGVTVLDPKAKTPTVTSHPDDMLHYCEPRILTVRELARLQSFPDWYEFKGMYTTGGKYRKTEVPRFSQVGNAIPPLFAEQAGLVIKEMLLQ